MTNEKVNGWRYLDWLHEVSIQGYEQNMIFFTELGPRLEKAWRDSVSPEAFIKLMVEERQANADRVKGMSAEEIDAEMEKWPQEEIKGFYRPDKMHFKEEVDYPRTDVKPAEQLLKETYDQLHDGKQKMLEELRSHFPVKDSHCPECLNDKPAEELKMFGGLCEDCANDDIAGFPGHG